MQNKDTEFMRLAIDVAKAAPQGEVPVGAVIVKDGAVIAAGHNLREQTSDVTAHAEIVAIRNACQKLGGWNLHGCTIYVTLEPCPMCAGAIIQSRIDRIVFGAYDPKGGAAGSVCNLLVMPFAGQRTVKGGVMEDECLAVLHNFFEEYIRSSEKTSCNFDIADV